MKNFFKFIFAIIIILDFCLSIFPNLSYIFNISIVILLLLTFIIKSFYYGISPLEVIIAIISGTFIIINKDISRVSLFIFLIFLEIYKYKISSKDIKFFLYMYIICMSIVIIAYCFGFNKRYDGEIWRPLLGKTLPRMSFGFTHPNQFMLKMYTIFILCLLVYDNIFVYFFEFVICFIFYNLTNSRTVFLAMSFIFIMLFINKLLLKLKKKKYKVYRLKLLSLGIPIMTIFSIVISLKFSNTIIDQLLSGRLIINKNFLDTGITLFGRTEYENAMFDNSYIQMLITKGLLFISVFSIIFYLKFKKLRFDFKTIIILLSLFMIGFMETCLLKYNIMFTIGMVVLYSKNNNKV